MITWYWIPISLAAGALIASYVGYRLNYNLYDWLKDKILGFIGKLFGKAKAEEQAVASKIKRIL